MPEHVRWPSGLNPGNDTVESPQERKRILDAVENLNGRLRFSYYGPTNIQKAADWYLVTFSPWSAEELKKAEKNGESLFEPFFNFLVTDTGVVFGWFPGE